MRTRYALLVALFAAMLAAQATLISCRTNPATERESCVAIASYDDGLRIEREARELLPLAEIRFAEEFAALQLQVEGIRMVGPGDAELMRLATHTATRQLVITEVPGAPCTFTANGLTQIQSMPNLERIEFYDCDPSQAVLAQIAGVASLRELVLQPLNGSSIGVQELRELAAAGNLRELHLVGVELQQGSLAAVADIASLEGLRLIDCAGMTSGGVSELDRLTNLRDLRMLGYQWDNAWTQHIASISSLEILDLTDCVGLLPQSIELLKALSNLRVLLLRNCGAQDSWLVHIGDMSKLEELDLYEGLFSDARISELTRLPELEVLGIEGCGITNLSIQHLRAIPKLRYLRLGWNPISASGLQQLENTKLARLELGGLAFRNEEASAVRDIESLQTLIVPDGLAISSIGFGSLSFMPNLTRLELGGGGLNDDDLISLRRMDKLRRLTLVDFEDITGSFVTQMVTTGSCVEELRLYGCDSLSDAGLEYISRLRNLDRLLLDLSNAGAVTQVTLSRIQNRSHLRELALLGWGNFSESDARELIKIEELTHLYIPGGVIDGSDLEYLQNRSAIATYWDAPVW